MPNKNTFPIWGKSVGGVSGRAGAKAGGSNPFAHHSFACRGGRRHPGLPDGGALRGASSERRPRSVRYPFVGFHPDRNAPATADVRRTPRRGTSSGSAIQATAADAGTIRRRMRSVDASFARSFDPCSSILTMHAARKRLVVGRSVRHHGWANPRKWEEPTLGSVERT
jgi:hypothetical protein